MAETKKTPKTKAEPKAKPETAEQIIAAAAADGRTLTDHDGAPIDLDRPQDYRRAILKGQEDAVVLVKVQTKAEPIEFVPGELEAAMKHNHQVAFWAHRQREIANEAATEVFAAKAKGDKATIKAVTDNAATKSAAAELATESSGTALTRALRAAEAVGENSKIIGELTTYRDYFGDASYREVSVYNRSWNEDENLYPNDLVLVPKPYDPREVQPDILNGRTPE